MKKIQKIKILFLLLAAVFVSQQVVLAQQSGDGYPQCQIVANKGTTVDIERVAECLENRYGIDKNAMRRFNKKENAPEVEIHYDITSPNEGDKVTALAVTKNFKNAVEDLYYTWYLVRSDDNGMPIGSIAEGKRRAMGIVARGEYDPELFGEGYGSDTDHDGFWASYGGNDGVGAKLGQSVGSWEDNPNIACDAQKNVVSSAAITRCYQHNFGIKVFDVEDEWSETDNRAGRDRIIECVHEFPSCDGYKLGDGEFGVEEEECWMTDPTNPDTDGDGIEDEADLVGLNQSQFTWKYRPGDLIGVVIEGTSMIPISEGCTQSSLENYRWCTPRPPAGYDIPHCEDTYEEIYIICEEWLVDEVDLGNASADSTGDNNGSSANVDVNLSADLDAYNEGMVNYEACIDSMYSTWDETHEFVDALNSYYKIMWAMPDICEKVHPIYGGLNGTEPISTNWDFMGGDHCGREGDVGFNYLAFVPLNEKGDMILDPELDVLPEDPQFDPMNFGTEQERTDLITVSATTSNPEVDEDFLFYSWQIDKCDENFVCTDTLTEDDGTIIFESYTNGLGVKKIKFRPTDTTFLATEDKIFLQATLVQSEHPVLIGGSDIDTRDFSVGAIETIIFPISKKELSLRFYMSELNPATMMWTFDPNEEICGPLGNPLYMDACPVYDYQVVAVQVDILGGIQPTDRVAWQLNGVPLPRPLDTTVYANADSLVDPVTGGPVDVIYLPVQGGNMDLQEISVTYKKVRGDEITDIVEGRAISVNNPIAVLNSPDASATPIELWNGGNSLNQYEAAAGDSVTFQATVVPDYLVIDNTLTLIEDIDPLDLADEEVHLMWYLNGYFVNDTYIADHPELGPIVVAGDSITFTMNPEGMFGSGYGLVARLEKTFNPDHVTMLDNAWKINDTHTITNDTSVNVKIEYGGPFPVGNNNLKEYLASSIANAPHYLIFTMRLGVAMALVWFVLFGFSYAIRLNKDL